MIVRLIKSLKPIFELCSHTCIILGSITMINIGYASMNKTTFWYGINNNIAPIDTTIGTIIFGAGLIALIFFIANIILDIHSTILKRNSKIKSGGLIE